MLTMKRLWPAFIVPPLRAWVFDHFPSGTVENFSIATSAPWNTLKPGGPPVPDGGLSGEISGTVSLRPVDTLPVIRDADLVAKFTGRTATVTLGSVIRRDAAFSISFFSNSGVKPAARMSPTSGNVIMPSGRTVASPLIS